MLGDIHDLGQSLKDEVGQRLRDLSKLYNGEEYGADAQAKRYGQHLSSRPTLPPAGETSLAQVLDGFLSLRPHPFKGEKLYEVEDLDGMGAWEELRGEAIRASETAAGQPDGLAAALKSARDAVQLAEEQFQAELIKKARRDQRVFDRHSYRRGYYLFALNLLTRVQQEAPELKGKAIEAAVALAQRVFRSRVGHAALTRGSSELLALQAKEAALRNELADLDATLYETVSTRGWENVATQRLEARNKALMTALEEMEEAGKEAKAVSTARIMGSVLPLREIQGHLAPDEAVLAYIMNDRALVRALSDHYGLCKSHIVVIRRDGAALVMLPRFNLPIDDDRSYDISAISLQKAMQRQAGLNRGLRQEDMTAPIPSLLTSAHRLYRQVVEPARGELEGIRHLIVVADGDLVQRFVSLFQVKLRVAGKVAAHRAAVQKVWDAG